MLQHAVKRLTWLGMVVALVGCTPDFTTSAQQANSAPATKAIVLADISTAPEIRIMQFQPMADYLASQLNQVGIGVGKVKIAPDMETMAKWLAAGEVDLYFDSPYPAMIVADRSKSVPLLQRWKEGVAEYHAVIFTHRGRNIKTLKDLNGKTIAFEDNFSTSGYMLPLAHMTQAGLKLVEQAEVTQPVGAGKVGYIFDEQGLQLVLNNRVAAATASISDFAKIPLEARKQLVVLAETESLPRNVVMVSPKLEPDERAAIKAVLLEMDRTPEGQAALQQFQETTQFEEFPQGADAAFSRMRELYELVKNNSDNHRE